jgi:NTP pyrophosphatase (non-canonical NTP hydrolase)
MDNLIRKGIKLEGYTLLNRLNEELQELQDAIFYEKHNLISELADVLNLSWKLLLDLGFSPVDVMTRKMGYYEDRKIFNNFKFPYPCEKDDDFCNCPHCGRSFSSDRGLQVHIGRVHKSQGGTDISVVDLADEAGVCCNCGKLDITTIFGLCPKCANESRNGS